MKSNQLLLVIITIIMCIACKEERRESSYATSTYVESTPICQSSTAKVRKLVRNNWSSIRSTADFTVSSKGSFEVQDYGMDGDDLVVDIYSTGYMYDISFSVSFDAYFDDNCTLKGEVTDCYNYNKH